MWRSRGNGNARPRGPVERLQRATDRVLESAGKETRRGRVLRILGWHWHVTQTSPTALELLVWGQTHGESLFDVNSVRPRLTELVGLGLVEPGTPRICKVSGQLVRTWRVREIGSLEPR